MSIILDALKKVQKDQSGNDENAQHQTRTVITSAGKKGLPLYISLPILLVATSGLMFLVYQQFFKKPGPTSVSQTEPLQIEPTAINTDEIEKQAHLFFEQKDYKKSLNQWQLLEKQKPGDTAVQNNLGLAAKKSGQNQTAKKAYEAALKIQPDYPEALNNLGILLFEMGESANAIGHLKQALEINPKYVEAHFNLGLVYEEQKKNMEAANHYTKFLKLSPQLDPRLKGKIEKRIALLLADQKKMQN